MRVGLIGCGRIAERGYVPAFARADGVQLAAVVDVQSERCRAVAQGVATFVNVGELVTSGEVDAVVVAGGHTDDAFALLVPGRSRLAKRHGDESVIDLTATACSLLGGDMSGLAGTPLLEPATG